MTALARPAIRPQALQNGATAFAADVLEGLAATPKRLPAKYFYDEAGSRLFERITELPEYYPTRTELRILESSAESIAGLADPGAALIEFGSGSTAKARLLLRHMVSVRAYVPVDISAEFVNGEAARLQADFPALRVLPVAADFTGAFELPAAVKAGPRLGFFPGSTIGNLEHHAFYHRELRRIEMHLASLRRQKVRILGKCFEFRAGETIHTENSYKYTIESFAALARGAGWSIGAVWTDPERYFAVQALV